MDKKLVSIRIAKDVDDEIVKFAQQHGQTRTDLFVKGALLLIEKMGSNQKPDSGQALPAFLTN